jgi:hypothetical protein
MPRFLFAAFALSFVALASAEAVAQAAGPVKAEIKRVQAEVALLRQGVFRILDERELDAALKVTHPSIIEAVGGLEKARANATATARQQAASLFKIEKVEFLMPPRFFAGTEHEFVLVPVAMTMSRADRTRNQSLTYYLGGRKKGDTDWVYVDAANLARGSAKEYFSDFPEGEEFPPILTRKLP